MAYQSRLPRIAAELAVRTDAAAAEAAVVIARHAKERVPVDTGRLRDAIHTERVGTGEHAVIAGDREVFYGHLVEHGGAHTPPRPFLIPAVDEARGELAALTLTALRDL